ncbi:Uncharacterized protein TCM_026440 [Theobroma cacao]|uniref:Uncharacterized protein n=1 Tax=Theobroma cacao TaxID=3641 RepID=A0A061F1L1_THECC|nr:Uncharacterized protein TCM_026440 [Theobroma cacao]
MAGYGYSYRGGYTTYSTGVPLRTDGWSKPSYTSDHACQPVIIDAEGRRKPIISYTPDGNTQCYVTKTEIVEHVPLVTGSYRQSSTPVTFEVVRDYGDGEGKWNRPSSPEKWRSPVRYHIEEKWNRPSSPVHEHESPQQVEEFITKVQTEASRPNQFGNLSATYWRQTPNSYPVNTGYGDQSDDLSNKEWQKPSGTVIRDDRTISGPYKNNKYSPEPNGNNGGVRTKPSPEAWSTPKGARLSEPTSDINTAVACLMEAAKPSSGITAPPPSRYTIPSVSARPKRATYSETIDSREAARRYGNANLPAARPTVNYATTIDSREAARKYGGTTV